MSREEVVEREERLAMPVALATIVGVLLILASIFFSVGGSDSADLLRNIDTDATPYLIGSVIRALGFLMLIPGLVYLFRAALARNEGGMRSQLLGVLIAAPIFLAVSSVLSSVAAIDAANTFVLEDPMGSSEEINDAAQDIRAEASLQPLATGFVLGGALGFAVGLGYACLHAMRTGLLTRFWGSLGMALGVVSFVIPFMLFFLLIWFIYLALLISGRMPSGRPPAWAEGRAIPWPTPGERAAEGLEGPLDPDDEPDDSVDGSDPRNPPLQPGERRKRKRRS